jgi:uncharacterized protein involved in tolerance to divalent cations
MITPWQPVPATAQSNRIRSPVATVLFDVSITAAVAAVEDRYSPASTDTGVVNIATAACATVGVAPCRSRYTWNVGMPEEDVTTLLIATAVNVMPSSNAGISKYALPLPVVALVPFGMTYTLTGRVFRRVSLPAATVEAAVPTFSVAEPPRPET